ncbi:hypothetical protein ACN20G_29845 (plasmid) [Streptomyces sp. BI20]|uniref:VG15 protein n=1 Tax=Streptomyces sp. BI20 TaxID=3403460 RepID=UPI003C724EC7
MATRPRSATQQLRNLQSKIRAESVRFHAAQEELAREAEKAVHDLFAGAPASDLADDEAGWFERFLAVILPFRRRSRELARDYYSRLRYLQGLDTGFAIPEPSAWAERNAVANGYFSQGPGGVLRELRKGEAGKARVDLTDPEFVAKLDEAMAAAVRAQERATVKQVQDAGRDAVADAVERDKDAIGFYIQINSPSPCAYCIMLASRGVSYKSRRTARAAFHDNCFCQPVPVFTRGIDGDEWTEKAKQLYKNTETRTSKGGKKYTAFKKGQE